MQRWIEFQPAYDRRKEGYGIHCTMMRWYLKGRKGVVQFVVSTGWHLPSVIEEYDTKYSNAEMRTLISPYAADVGYHSPVPVREWQTPDDIMECHLLEGGKCYYDGSSLRAEDFYKILVEQGSEAVWNELRDYYIGIFGEQDEELSMIDYYGQMEEELINIKED